MNYLNKYLEYSEQHGDSGRVAIALYQIGVVNSHLGNYDQALKSYYRSISIEEKAGNDYSVD
ncbi:MAG TPA: tetratricopeptide repeat protein [Flavitalea sp.]|nr:tetratricopeptide repeat protein [Flavitalea sp.]